jgi:hypothetical protein
MELRKPGSVFETDQKSMKDTILELSTSLLTWFGLGCHSEQPSGVELSWCCSFHFHFEFVDGHVIPLKLQCPKVALLLCECSSMNEPKMPCCHSIGWNALQHRHRFDASEQEVKAGGIRVRITQTLAEVRAIV